MQKEVKLEWFFLSLAGVLYCFGCWFTYANQHKDKWWYIPLGTGVGMLTSVVWFWAAKLITDKDRMYIFNLKWDSIIMLIYYLLPLMMFGAKLDRWGWVGVIFITIGAIILKFK